MGNGSWDSWVVGALARLESLNLLRSLRPIHIRGVVPQSTSDDYEVFDKMQPWDRSSVEVFVSGFAGEEDTSSSRATGHNNGQLKKLLLFSGNDYLGLSSHPTAKAAAQAAQEHGMGPRGSALICGYTHYHRLLESSLADLKKKEVLQIDFDWPGIVATNCILLLCSYMISRGVCCQYGIHGSPWECCRLLAAPETPVKREKIAIFSDALNHASIIDGIRLADQQGTVEVHVYRHCEMSHLNSLLSGCVLKKKVVVTDGDVITKWSPYSLFSMDGDFAPMAELVRLRKIHGFLLVIDDAHGMLVCGKHGGGVAEEFNCETDVDVCIGTLSKAAGCHGGFIACSEKWKQLIQSRGRSFIFSTASPVPIVAAAYAAVVVAKKEQWRRREIWNRVHDFQALTGIPITSPIISLVVGSEERALQASRHLLESGFHVTAIRPPTVPPNSCRLRVTLAATHTTDDVKKLASALSCCINFDEVRGNVFDGYARL